MRTPEVERLCATLRYRRPERWWIIGVLALLALFALASEPPPPASAPPTPDRSLSP